MTSTDQLEKPPPTKAKLIAGTAFSVGKISEARIIALAAASAPDSTDPVDLAIKKTLRRDYPQLQMPEVDARDVDPATAERKYSLTRVREYPREDGTKEDLVVMRGELQAILPKVKKRLESRSVFKKKAKIAIQRGWRPLAVAVAHVKEDGTVGPFTLHGFVSIGHKTGGEEANDADIASGPATWARIYVWSPSLRVQHWANVALVFILSCSGYFILDPFFGSTSVTGEPSGYLMGYVRFLHFCAAFAWLVTGLTRIWAAFTSSDRYLRLSSLWPLKKKEDFVNLGKTFQHYTFIKTESPMYLAHNPLQQLTYTGVYVLCGVQMLTGFTLFGLYHQDNWFWAFMATPIHIFGVAYIRLFHTIVMFLLWGLVIGHVYLVFRADSVERHGGLSAMINGGVWVQRGTQPVDAPKVE
ncbi:MAG: cytochrome b/b6 domain-containing protein [Propionibacteriaceae bacterium]|nr:cytochrome b/b6 domain-containing protein [Propionibacteriaceae bacterium]